MTLNITKNKKEEFIKLAKQCAKKFEYKQLGGSSYFIGYCSKKLNSVLQTKIPSTEELTELKKILSVYDQIFYSRDSKDENCFLHGATFEESNDSKILNSQNDDVNNQYGIGDLDEPKRLESEHYNIC